MQPIERSPQPAPATPASAFRCSVCGGGDVARTVDRGDGEQVLFCSACGMGILARRPVCTAAFYSDAYYSQSDGQAPGYADYEFTAEHGLLWAVLLTEALAPANGAVLDIGCAQGSLLRRLRGAVRRCGIEVNAAAAAAAAAGGIEIIGDDVLDPGLVAAYAGTFDVITAIATFEHVLDIRAAVAASLALLAPSGVLIFEIPLISETRNNSDWFNGSYEHIFYPTVGGIEALFAVFPGVHFQGFEANITGFSSTYIGVATRDPARFASAQKLIAAMTAEDPQTLPDDEARLNLAYTVVHNFHSTPEHISRLPVLLERYFTPHLAVRLTQLWHDDALRAAASDWHKTQAQNWQAAAEALQLQVQAAAEALQLQVATLQTKRSWRCGGMLARLGFAGRRARRRVRVL